ncbi:homeodomain superfamily [Cryomyces antarcticus]|nr:homeodomain superfamily [Cryomyces antarcticus]
MFSNLPDREDRSRSPRGSYDRVSTAWPLPREAGSDHIAHTVTQSNSNTYCNGHQRLPLFYGQQPSHVAYGIYDDNPHRYTFAAHGAADSNGQRRRRGNLPKEATRMFKDWFEANIQSPYPSEDLKLQFCEQTGLTMNQVGNWFINQRRRTPLLRHKREEPLANDGSDES